MPGSVFMEEGKTGHEGGEARQERGSQALVSGSGWPSWELFRVGIPQDGLHPKLKSWTSMLQCCHKGKVASGAELKPELQG